MKIIVGPGRWRVTTKTTGLVRARAIMKCFAGLSRTVGPGSVSLSSIHKIDGPRRLSFITKLIIMRIRRTLVNRLILGCVRRGGRTKWKMEVRDHVCFLVIGHSVAGAVYVVASVWPSLCSAF